MGSDAAVWLLLAATALDPAESRDRSRVLPERRRAYHNLLAAWAARQRGD